jgi:CHAT domain-containing protein
MIKDLGGKKFRNPECLKDEDFYRYISGDARPEELGIAEAHLAQCSKCRQDLAELLELLHPEEMQETGIPEASKAELDRTIESIRDVARKEQPARYHFTRRLQWPIAAAAAIGFLALSIFGLKHLYEKNRSQAFYDQARVILEQSYTGTSPGNLRLSLPFQSASSNRKSPDSESLRTVETLFYQALAVRDDMPEARLGLGYIYLTESKYDRAREEFQAVLGLQKENVQAFLGRGVAQYEEVVQGTDPLRRYEILQKALEDFDSVLRLNPDSAEARYNRIWTLFESGMHKEALREIDRYLSKDPRSIWAEELKGLRIKIQSISDAGIQDLINRAARERDQSVLLELARQVPHRIPGEIRAALRRSLWTDQEASAKGASSEDLRWAAETMEAGYSALTGDHSGMDIIRFYVGLSPPQREIKRSLDEKFQEILKLHKNGELDLALDRIKSLELQYLQIKDFWQIYNIHHMRGNSLYMGKADFRDAEVEYRQMYEIASHLNSPELTARALKSLANIYGELRDFNRAFASANKLNELAGKYKLAFWQSSAHDTLGNQYLDIGQLEQSLEEYAGALKMGYPLFAAINIIEALESSGVAMEKLGRVQEAEAYYGHAIREHGNFLKNQIMQPTPDLELRRVNLIFRRGDLAMRIGDLAKAESFWRESLNATASEMLELEARSRLGLAEICLKTKRLHEAESILSPAMARAASGQYPEIEWKAKFLKGRILEESGSRSKALLSFKESVRILEHMRQYVRPGDLRQGFLSDRYDPFKAIARLLAQSPGNEQELLEFLDRAKARTLNETLDRLDPGNDSSSNPTVEKEHAFATVEYFFMGDRLLIMTTAGEHTRFLIRNISVEEMSRQVREFLNCIRANDSGNFILHARQLYDQLISPVEKWVLMSSTDALVILPDGPLYLLPFAGLQDTAGRFLIEKTPLTYAPSRSIFRHCIRLGCNLSNVNNDLLLVNGSKGLPKAQEELAYISNLYGRNVSIVGTKEMPIPMGIVERSRIFHFLGHSTIRQGRPVLMLQVLPKEVVLDCPIIRRWKMPRSRLVNLAGCSTGIGPVAEGEAPWGLIPAFLDAGAPAIIASLMDVDDASTATLNCRFYDQLQKGAGIAQALQKAQIALLTSARDGSGVNPRSWIPYVLVGNPQ